AAYYSHEGANALNVDAVDPGSKARDFRNRGRDLLRAYQSRVPSSAPGDQAAAAVVNWDRTRLHMPRRRYQ
ncbi:hypothetical protein, partial [Bowmanella denitrificans]|uniref:hypothetical protein n=1 Tax=Bowmanella denitrificans TaxID=366582 RepID=UPI001558AFB0